MDPANDALEEATYAYLMFAKVRGSVDLTVDHMCNVIDMHVGVACRYFQAMSLPMIRHEVLSVIASRLPDEFRDREALKVYSVGTEAWTQVETVEYWFVDQSGRWCWIKSDEYGNDLDFAETSAHHLVSRRSHDDKVSLSVLEGVCNAIQGKFLDEARRARVLADELAKTAALFSRGIALNVVTPPSAL